MSLSQFKKIFAVVVLMSFVAVTLSSFIVMTHDSDSRLIGDCPFVAMGASLCPQDTLATSIHQVLSYRSFLSISPDIGIDAALLALFLATYLVLILFATYLFWNNQHLVTVHTTNGPPRYNSYKQKIGAWLSLFENSPSLS